MLEKTEQKKLKKSEVSDRLTALREELHSLENVIKEKKLPVIITFDGWSASGKGSLIAKLIKNLDPRFFNVISFRSPNSQELRMPWLHRYWKVLPRQGEILILDRSWYRDTVNAYSYGEVGKEEYKKRLDDINVLERQLADDGYLLVKFFLHISPKEQQQRIEKLMGSDITSWRVNDHDLLNMRCYDKIFKRYDKMLVKTNTSAGVWNIIPADDKVTAELNMLEITVNAIKSAVGAKERSEKFVLKSDFPLTEVPKKQFALKSQVRLSDISLDKSLTEEEYQEKLDKYQEKLYKLQSQCYQKKIPVIICYEGWDAGGKGGNIKRVAAALDPRGCCVKPISSPEPSELARHYLWRFWTRLEKDGHFTIFDRTWYGRVMVEPIEKLTPENRVEQAYQEINEFEQQLIDWGAVVIKFWLHIDKDEQLRRFKERENTPEKRWKITDEDWRNREKWEEYEKAVNKMLELTSTQNAPWTVIEGNDKKYARIKALKTICRCLEERLDK